MTDKYTLFMKQHIINQYSWQPQMYV